MAVRYCEYLTELDHGEKGGEDTDGCRIVLDTSVTDQLTFTSPGLECTLRNGAAGGKEVGNNGKTDN